MNYIPSMEWTVLLDDDFEAWLLEQTQVVRVGIVSRIALLAKAGPALGRPQVDTLAGSTLANLKELRIQVQGDPWRVLFVFDPKRRAIPNDGRLCWLAGTNGATNAGIKRTSRLRSSVTDAIWKA
jgi:hypothetical protein